MIIENFYPYFFYIYNLSVLLMLKNCRVPFILVPNCGNGKQRNFTLSRTIPWNLIPQIGFITGELCDSNLLTTDPVSHNH